MFTWPIFFAFTSLLEFSIPIVINCSEIHQNTPLIVKSLGASGPQRKASDSQLKCAYFTLPLLHSSVDNTSVWGPCAQMWPNPGSPSQSYCSLIAFRLNLHTSVALLTKNSLFPRTLLLFLDLTTSLLLWTVCFYFQNRNPFEHSCWVMHCAVSKQCGKSVILKYNFSFQCSFPMIVNAKKL